MLLKKRSQGIHPKPSQIFTDFLTPVNTKNAYFCRVFGDPGALTTINQSFSP
jgi:hypothetical protein